MLKAILPAFLTGAALVPLDLHPSVYLLSGFFWGVLFIPMLHVERN